MKTRFVTRLSYKIWFPFFLPLIMSDVVRAENISGSIQQLNTHQQDQQKALQHQPNTTGRDVHTETETAVGHNLEYVDDAHCLKIKQIILKKDAAIPHWLPLQRIANLAVDHCMTPHNIKVVAIIIQNKLIDAGYITSRTELPVQNVHDGTLTIKVNAGRVGKIYLQDDADKYVHIANTFPTYSGKILDLRDLEQGLENMQGIPTADIHIRLIPTSEEARNDVVIDRSQSEFWRAAGWIDDAGSKATGRYQAGAALYLDNPTSLNDLFYLSATHDLQHSRRSGSKSTAVNYRVPLGYWSFTLYASENNYHQALAGHYSRYQYRGENRMMMGKISRILHRGAQQKTTLATQFIRRNMRYYIGDTELALQKVDVTNLRVDLGHRHYISDTVIDADISVQRNVHGPGGGETPAVRYGVASDISRIVTLDLQALVPFKLAGLSMSWQPRYYQQYSPDTLITQDQISLGNRWSVRGFNGEQTLMGSRGGYLSNTVNIDTSQAGDSQLYLGVDYGRVSQIDPDGVQGHSITGGVLGFRGAKWQTGYDVFAGVPLAKPRDLATDNITLGFTLQWVY